MSIEGQGHFFTIYFQVLYVLCFTRPRYQVSVYRTIGPLVIEYEPRCEKTCLRGPTHLYYLCSEDIGADQLGSYMYRASDLRLRFHIYISKK